MYSSCRRSTHHKLNKIQTETKGAEIKVKVKVKVKPVFLSPRQLWVNMFSGGQTESRMVPLNLSVQDHHERVVESSKELCVLFKLIRNIKLTSSTSTLLQPPCMNKASRKSCFPSPVWNSFYMVSPPHKLVPDLGPSV